VATLGRWTGGAVTAIPTTTFAVPTSDIFPTQARNDGSAYALSNHVLTLPSSDLANGYLIIARVRYDDDSNGRFSVACRFTQSGGTGDFVNGQTGGFARNTNNDDGWVSNFAFVNNPSASSTFTFQWERESDVPTNGTLKASLDVIPLFYSNHGLYTGSTTGLLGGTTPNVVTIGSTVAESDTAAIERATNVVTVKGTDTRYFVISSQWYQDRGEPGTTRTQRWFGHDYDGTQDDAAKTYAYYRQGSADGTGGHIFDIIETSGATDKTIEMTAYRGDGVSNNQGGADVDGQAPTQAITGLVVLELNSTAEVFRRTDATGAQALDGSSPLDINAARTADILDAASWAVVGTVGLNAEVAMDALTGANVSAASSDVTSGERGSWEANITLDGTEDANVFHGNYCRGNQGTEDTFGVAFNPVGFMALALDEDLGVSVTQTGGDAEHPSDTQAGWVGFWGINLDTMATAGDQTANVTPVTITYTVPVVTVNLTVPVVPLTITYTVPTVATDSTVPVTPVTVTYTVPAVITDLSFTSNQTPVTITYVVPTVTVDITVPVTSVVVTYTVPAVTTDLVFSTNQTPVVITYTVPVVTVNQGQSVVVAPIIVTYTIPVVTVDITVPVNPVVITYVIPVVATNSTVPVTSITITYTVPVVVVNSTVPVIPVAITYIVPAVTITLNFNTIQTPVVVNYTVPPVVLDLTVPVIPVSVTYTIPSVTTIEGLSAFVGPVVINYTVSSVTTNSTIPVTPTSIIYTVPVVTVDAGGGQTGGGLWSITIRRRRRLKNG